MLTAGGIELCYNDASRERLRQMRALYEPYAEALSRFLLMPLPQWFYDQPRKDNWQTVARLRAQTEAPNSADRDPANPDPVNPFQPLFASDARAANQTNSDSSTAAPALAPTVVDHPHDF